MKPTTLHRVLVCATLPALLFLAARFSVPASAARPVVDAAFVAERCVGCHDLDKTCRKFGRKDRNAWHRTVKRMVEKHETDISPATVREVADYLAEPDDALLGRCGE